MPTMDRYGVLYKMAAIIVGHRFFYIFLIIAEIGRSVQEELSSIEDIWTDHCYERF